jgi:DNA modification methylase/DNA-binding XRE family transcriptional regulator
LDSMPRTRADLNELPRAKDDRQRLDPRSLWRAARQIIATTERQIQRVCDGKNAAEGGSFLKTERLRKRLTSVQNRMNFASPPPETSALGSQVRMLRDYRRVSRARVAQETGLAPDTVAAVEGGHGSVASLSRVLLALNGTLSGCQNAAELGPWLRAKRQSLSLTQEQAADNAGVSCPTIHKLERGKGQIRSLLSLLKCYAISAQVQPLEASPAWSVLQGDATALLPSLPAKSFDALISDPPYALGDARLLNAQELLRTWAAGEDFDFSRYRSHQRSEWADARWDDALPQPSLFREAFRVLKPGAHALVFAAPRMAHLIAIALQFAGFEIRDQVIWFYKTGFHPVGNVARAIGMRKAKSRILAGEPMPELEAKRRFPRIGARATDDLGYALSDDDIKRIVPEAASEMEKHAGLGKLRPAHEVIILARKPVEGTVIDNVCTYGTGALHVHAARFVSAGGERFPMNVLGDATGDGYFYCPRASNSERDRHLPAGIRNEHPTVKPLNLMRYLTRLVARPGASVLDAFTGSGTTGIAATLEGCNFVGIEREPDYVALARARISGWLAA